MSSIKSFEPTYTGLGKDAPGSPITAGVRLSDRGIVCDLNSRGGQIFLDIEVPTSGPAFDRLSDLAGGAPQQ